ncbi:enolase C-terminal domain-like protein [Ruania alba]|uniref:L-alanine-DL-glutamate epimerase n=1 Tax=Ruania alba TaxID=648782 RepID=A0A1H5H804_9MICO|nr:enolase C-terminal domain-like protein [Ruania alba]SEE23378.1 L-alanine-DL-glutamate epimerase [Ruania alba]
MPTITELTIVEFDHTVTYAYDALGRKLPGSAPPTRTTRRFGVRIRTSEGIEGSYITLWSAPPLATPQVAALAQAVVGRSLGERELLWDHANRAQAKSDRIGYGAIDIALWDAMGKTAGQPISALLGRYRDRLPAYVSTVGGGHGLGGLATPESYRDYAHWCAERGIPGYKIHGPGTGRVRDEIAALRAAAEGSAGRSDVMTDPGNGLSTLADALKLGAVCDEVGAFWWEDPMRDDARLGHAILRDRVRTPLLITEFVRGLDQRVELAIAGATDFLRADPELDMGITGVMKTAHAAEALGIDMEVHASGPAQRHCMAAIRNTNYYELGLLDPETGNPLHPPVYADDYAEDVGSVGTDGCVAVPTGPGLGVTYDWNRILSMNADSRVFTAHA